MTKQQAKEALKDMTAPEILSAVRENDRAIIKALVIDGVKNRGIWTQAEVAELTGTNPSTVSRWINGDK